MSWGHLYIWRPAAKIDIVNICVLCFSDHGGDVCGDDLQPAPQAHRGQGGHRRQQEEPRLAGRQQGQPRPRHTPQPAQVQGQREDHSRGEWTDGFSTFTHNKMFFQDLNGCYVPGPPGGGFPFNSRS